MNLKIKLYLTSQQLIYQEKDAMTEISDLLYQLKVTEEKMTTLFEKRLHISLTRYQILQTLLDQSPLSQIDLQEALQIDQAAITRHLKVLEQEGYIQRQRNPQNQRQMMVTLTDKAVSELVIQPPQEHLRIKREMETLLTQEELANLKTLLEKMKNGLENISSPE